MKFSPKIMGIIVSLVLVVLVGSVIYAAMTLNQDVGVTITVNPAPGGGGGGGPVPQPTSAYIYKDSAFAEVLTTLTFTYNEGGNASVTAYIKDGEISTLGTPTVTGMTGITINAVFGNVVGSAKEVVITASGGNATTKDYSGSVNFIGS